MELNKEVQEAMEKKDEYFKNLTISIGCENTQNLLKSKFWDYEVNKDATASTYTLDYENKTEFIIHIHEKVLNWSYQGMASIAAHEAYHYCLSNFSTEDEEFFAYRMENLVGMIVNEIIETRDKEYE